MSANFNFDLSSTIGAIDRECARLSQSMREKSKDHLVSCFQSHKSDDSTRYQTQKYAGSSNLFSNEYYWDPKRSSDTSSLCTAEQIINEYLVDETSFNRSLYSHDVYLPVGFEDTAAVVSPRTEGETHNAGVLSLNRTKLTDATACGDTNICGSVSKYGSPTHLFLGTIPSSPVYSCKKPFSEISLPTFPSFSFPSSPLTQPSLFSSATSMKSAKTSTTVLSSKKHRLKSSMLNKKLPPLPTKGSKPKLSPAASTPNHEGLCQHNDAEKSYETDDCDTDDQAHSLETPKLSCQTNSEEEKNSSTKLSPNDISPVYPLSDSPDLSPALNSNCHTPALEPTATLESLSLLQSPKLSTAVASDELAASATTATTSNPLVVAHIVPPNQNQSPASSSAHLRLLSAIQQEQLASLKHPPSAPSADGKTHLKLAPDLFSQELERQHNTKNNSGSSVQSEVENRFNVTSAIDIYKPVEKPHASPFLSSPKFSTPPLLASSPLTLSPARNNSPDTHPTNSRRKSLKKSDRPLPKTKSETDAKPVKGNKPTEPNHPQSPKTEKKVLVKRVKSRKTKSKPNQQYHYPPVSSNYEPTRPAPVPPSAAASSPGTFKPKGKKTFVISAPIHVISTPANASESAFESDTSIVRLTQDREKKQATKSQDEHSGFIKIMESHSDLCEDLPLPLPIKTTADLDSQLYKSKHNVKPQAKQDAKYTSTTSFSFPLLPTFHPNTSISNSVLLPIPDPKTLAVPCSEKMADTKAAKDASDKHNPVPAKYVHFSDPEMLLHLTSEESKSFGPMAHSVLPNPNPSTLARLSLSVPVSSYLYTSKGGPSKSADECVLDDAGSKGAGKENHKKHYNYKDFPLSEILKQTEEYLEDLNHSNYKNINIQNHIRGLRDQLRHKPVNEKHDDSNNTIPESQSPSLAEVSKASRPSPAAAKHATDVNDSISKPEPHCPLAVLNSPSHTPRAHKPLPSPSSCTKRELGKEHALHPQDYLSSIRPLSTQSVSNSLLSQSLSPPLSPPLSPRRHFRHSACSSWSLKQSPHKRPSPALGPKTGVVASPESWRHRGRKSNEFVDLRISEVEGAASCAGPLGTDEHDPNGCCKPLKGNDQTPKSQPGSHGSKFWHEWETDMCPKTVSATPYSCKYRYPVITMNELLSSFPQPLPTPPPYPLPNPHSNCRSCPNSNESLTNSILQSLSYKPQAGQAGKGGIVTTEVSTKTALDQQLSPTATSIPINIPTKPSTDRCLDKPFTERYLDKPFTGQPSYLCKPFVETSPEAKKKHHRHTISVELDSCEMTMKRLMESMQTDPGTGRRKSFGVSNKPMHTKQIAENASLEKETSLEKESHLEQTAEKAKRVVYKRAETVPVASSADGLSRSSKVVESALSVAVTVLEPVGSPENGTNSLKDPKSLKELKGHKVFESPKELNSPKASKSPRVPKSPKASKSPKEPKSPKVSKSPKEPKSPKALKSPKEPKSPKASKSPNGRRQLFIRRFSGFHGNETHLPGGPDPHCPEQAREGLFEDPKVDLGEPKEVASQQKPLDDGRNSESSIGGSSSDTNEADKKMWSSSTATAMTTSASESESPYSFDERFNKAKSEFEFLVTPPMPLMLKPVEAPTIPSINVARHSHVGGITEKDAGSCERHDSCGYQVYASDAERCDDDGDEDEENDEEDKDKDKNKDKGKVVSNVMIRRKKRHRTVKSDSSPQSLRESKSQHWHRHLRSVSNNDVTWLLNGETRIDAPPIPPRSASRAFHQQRIRSIILQNSAELMGLKELVEGGPTGLVGPMGSMEPTIPTIPIIPMEPIKPIKLIKPIKPTIPMEPTTSAEPTNPTASTHSIHPPLTIPTPIDPTLAHALLTASALSDPSVHGFGNHALVMPLHIIKKRCGSTRAFSRAGRLASFSSSPCLRSKMSASSARASIGSFDDLLKSFITEDLKFLDNDDSLSQLELSAPTTPASLSFSHSLGGTKLSPLQSLHSLDPTTTAKERQHSGPYPIKDPAASHAPMARSSVSLAASVSAHSHKSGSSANTDHGSHKKSFARSFAGMLSSKRSVSSSSKETFHRNAPTLEKSEQAGASAGTSSLAAEIESLPYSALEDVAGIPGTNAANTSNTTNVINPTTTFPDNDNDTDSNYSNYDNDGSSSFKSGSHPLPPATVYTPGLYDTHDLLPITESAVTLHSDAHAPVLETVKSPSASSAVSALTSGATSMVTAQESPNATECQDSVHEKFGHPYTEAIERTTPVTVPMISTGNATSAGTAVSLESPASPLTETKPTTPKTSRPGPLPAPKKEVSAVPAVKKRLSVATRLKMFGRKK